jgi:hypothetical protein
MIRALTNQLQGKRNLFGFLRTQQENQEVFGPPLFSSQEHTPFREMDQAWCIIMLQPLGMNQAQKKEKWLWGVSFTNTTMCGSLDF